MRRASFVGIATLVTITVVLGVAPSTLGQDNAIPVLALGIEQYNRGDLVAAMGSFRRAAEAGSPEAQVRLAWILDQAEENAEAVRWYEAAAAQGDAEGMFGLGQMYAKGDGVERDPERARRSILQAAGLDHVGAINVLAAAYENGELGLEADQGEAGRWLLRAAEQGDRRAMERIAQAYRTGELGLAADAELADRWQRQATKAGESGD